MLEFACVSVIFNEMSDQTFVSPAGSQPTGMHHTLQSTHVSFLLNHLFFG